MDKNDEHWSMIKHGEDGKRTVSKNRVSGGVFTTLEPPWWHPRTWMKYTRWPFINFVHLLIMVLPHLIFGWGPCNLDQLLIGYFLGPYCRGKDSGGVLVPPWQGGTKSPHLPSTNTNLKAPFKIWVLYRLKVRHRCNFAYFVCVLQLDKKVTKPTFINKAFLLYSQYLDCNFNFLLVLHLRA